MDRFELHQSVPTYACLEPLDRYLSHDGLQEHGPTLRAPGLGSLAFGARGTVLLYLCLDPETVGPVNEVGEHLFGGLVPRQGGASWVSWAWRN